jgi:tRNA G18 (ribose-2'-O)-methylase SpoU
MRGYFGIGIEHCKTSQNIGTLWRSAFNLGASFIFTVGHRYKRQASDTVKAWRHIPLFQVDTIEELKRIIPYDCLLVGVENTDDARPIKSFTHPERAIYLLGSEDIGLSKNALSKCQQIIILPSNQCLNVSVAGALVMYDRFTKDSK